MLYFHKEYYNLKTTKEKELKLAERLNYDSVIKTNLKIKLMNRQEQFVLYYVPTNETIELISEISRIDVVLENLYEGLPGLAQINFFIDMLGTELQSTNELEGVRSSKEEIVQTTKKILNIKKEKKVNLRFKNVINSYFRLKDGNLKLPIDSQDVRKIYDEITVDGVLKEDFPDGKYFRNNITYIYKNNKEIHRGIYEGENTEKAIIDRLNDVITFMDTNSAYRLHKLIKIAIAHYYFGNIHPFYDGNGRTGRFISSIYLKEAYSWLTAMSLSQGCNKERNKYLKIFHTTNQISSQGEMNYFVDEFLSIILLGQQEIFENLALKKDLLNEIIEKIGKDEALTNQDEKTILGIMAQEHHFNSLADGIGIEDLKEVFNYTNETIRLKLKELYNKGLIEKIKSRPVRYVISKGYLE